jgi:tetrahydromethanopterin S-methyltransferase subunit G
LENRVSTVEIRINEVESHLNNRINEVESRLSKEIREVFKWMVGMMIPVWIGVLLGVLVQLIKG